MAVAGLAALARGARDVDDPPAAPLLHVRHRGADHVERAGQVDADHLVPLAVADLLDRRALPDARVVDQDVEPAEPVDRLVDHHLGLFVDGDVRGQRERLAAAVADPPGHLLRGGALHAVVEGHARAGAGQDLRTGPSDAA